MQPLTQGYKLHTSGCIMETIYIPHVESGQHEAMLFTVWLNPQIVLTSSESKEMIHMNIYTITATINLSRMADTWCQWTPQRLNGFARKANHCTVR